MPVENAVPRRVAEGEATLIAPAQRKTDHSSAENVTRRSVLRGAALGFAALASGVDPVFVQQSSAHPTLFSSWQMIWALRM